MLGMESIILNLLFGHSNSKLPDGLRNARGEALALWPSGLQVPCKVPAPCSCPDNTGATPEMPENRFSLKHFSEAI